MNDGAQDYFAQAMQNGLAIAAQRARQEIASPADNETAARIGDALFGYFPAMPFGERQRIGNYLVRAGAVSTMDAAMLHDTIHALRQDVARISAALDAEKRKAAAPAETAADLESENARVPEQENPSGVDDHCSTNDAARNDESSLTTVRDDD